MGLMLLSGDRIWQPIYLIKTQSRNLIGGSSLAECKRSNLNLQKQNVAAGEHQRQRRPVVPPRQPAETTRPEPLVRKDSARSPVPDSSAFAGFKHLRGKFSQQLFSKLSAETERRIFPGRTKRRGPGVNFIKLLFL